MSAWQAAKPIHPLLGIASSLFILVGGLLFVRRECFPALLLALVLLYAAFGLAAITLRFLFIFIPVSTAFALVSFAFSRDTSIALQMGSRVLWVGLCAIPLMSLPLINLIRSLNQLRVPRYLSLGMLISVRFVPVLVQEVQQVRQAMRSRGASSSLLRPRVFYRAFFMPLLMRLLSISDTLSLSLETRAFDLKAEGSTLYRRIVFSRRDAIYLFLVLGLLLAMGVMR